MLYPPRSAVTIAYKFPYKESLYSEIPAVLDNRINIEYAILLLVIVTNLLKKFIVCDLKDEFLPCEALALFLQVLKTMALVMSRSLTRQTVVNIICTHMY